MTRDELKWPNLTQLGTMEAPAIALLSGITSGIALPFSKVVAAVLFVPFVLWIFCGVLVGIVNEIRRLLWLRWFDNVKTFSRIRAKLEQEPSRFLLHLATYGGFDRERLRPAIVIEDAIEGQFHAIYPGAYSVIEKCQELGIREYRK